jgi:hypothetical protein
VALPGALSPRLAPVLILIDIDIGGIRDGSVIASDGGCLTVGPDVFVRFRTVTGDATTSSAFRLSVSYC